MKKSLQKKISTACALLVFITIVGILPYNSYAQNTRPKQKPNFIFILIDDLGWTSSSQLMDGKITNSKSDYYGERNLFNSRKYFVYSMYKF